MQVASVSVRFGLMLEAYCRGSIEHMKTLIRQMEFLEKLKKTTELVRQKRDKEKARSFLQEYFQDLHCFEAMTTVQSPLDPSYKCKRIKYVGIILKHILLIIHVYNIINVVRFCYYIYS